MAFRSLLVAVLAFGYAAIAALNSTEGLASEPPSHDGGTTWTGRAGGMILPMLQEATPTATPTPGSPAGEGSGPGSGQGRGQGGAQRVAVQDDLSARATVEAALQSESQGLVETLREQNRLQEQLAQERERQEQPFIGPILLPAPTDPAPAPADQGPVPDDGRGPTGADAASSVGAPGDATVPAPPESSAAAAPADDLSAAPADDPVAAPADDPAAAQQPIAEDQMPEDAPQADQPQTDAAFADQPAQDAAIADVPADVPVEDPLVAIDLPAALSDAPTAIPTAVPQPTAMAPATSQPTPVPTETATPAPATSVIADVPTPTAAFPTLAPGSQFNAPRDMVGSSGPPPTMRPMPNAIGSSYMPSYTGYPIGAAGTPGTTSSAAPGMPVPNAPGSIAPATGAGATPTPSGETSHTGSWSGFTSQGRQISFTVSGDAITSISASYSITGCLSQDGTISQQYTTPNSAPPAVTDNSFYIVATPSAGIGFGFIQGTFSSPTSASGTLKMALISLGSIGADGTPCSPAADATWTASRS